MAMNVFQVLRRYATKWQEKEVRNFSGEEIRDILSAEVVDSQYGYSVCFMMRTGGKTYIPLDESSTLSTGAKVDVHTALLVTLTKEGEDDIYRVRA